MNCKSTLFSSYSLSFISDLSKTKIPIFFIITRCSSPSISNDSTNLTIQSLNKISLRQQKIFPIDQTNSLNQNGVKELFRQIYNYFNLHRFDLESFREISSKNIIFQKLTSSIFFDNTKRPSDLVKKWTWIGFVRQYGFIFLSILSYGGLGIISSVFLFKKGQLSSGVGIGFLVDKVFLTLTRKLMLYLLQITIR